MAKLLQQQQYRMIMMAMNCNTDTLTGSLAAYCSLSRLHSEVFDSVLGPAMSFAVIKQLHLTVLTRKTEHNERIRVATSQKSCISFNKH